MIYADPRLILAIRIQILVIPITDLTEVHIILFEREFKYNMLFGKNLISNLI